MVAAALWASPYFPGQGGHNLRVSCATSKLEEWAVSIYPPIIPPLQVFHHIVPQDHHLALQSPVMANVIVDPGTGFNVAKFRECGKFLGSPDLSPIETRWKGDTHIPDW